MWPGTLSGEPPYRQLIVPYPNVHLSFVNGVARIHGVARGHVRRTLEERGRVFGVAFRPGGFRPFLRRPVSMITDRSVSASEVFGVEMPEVPMASASDPAEMRGIVEEFLCANLPERDPTAEAVADIVARIADDRGITRTDALAADLGMGVRRLQRLFADYVGVGPKWVIRRYRLREVTDRMATGEAIDWAGLAADLGYADQAHFIRDFTAMVGESPTVYAERYPRRGRQWYPTRTVENRNESTTLCEGPSLHPQPAVALEIAWMASWASRASPGAGGRVHPPRRSARERTSAPGRSASRSRTSAARPSVSACRIPHGPRRSHT
ncbi:MAG: helix-turn-helix domain-containing protein, partial [Egibacteraceae bacterium]